MLTENTGPGETWVPDLRDEIVSGFLEAANQARGDEDFPLECWEALKRNSALQRKILDNAKNPVIRRRWVLGSLPERVRPLAKKYITDLLLLGVPLDGANC